MACKDETGNKYGLLTVLERVYPHQRAYKNAYWKCQCECGNITTVEGSKLRSGETKSCGCLRKRPSKNTVNLIGQKFGMLTVISQAPSSNTGLAKWNCICDCGNTTEVMGCNLRTGHTTSCGCQRARSLIKYNTKDISNQRFGKLIALYPTEKRKGINTIWHCKCECGNECDVDINSLTQFKKQSCGCSSVYVGEEIIAQILSDNNIPFERQKIFDSCRFEETNYPAKFDFYVDNKYLIEFDGIQHFKYNNSGWNTEENFRYTQKHDTIKNEWCKKNNVPLIRIPYTHIKQINLKDLILDTTTFLI